MTLLGWKKTFQERFNFAENRKMCLTTRKYLLVFIIQFYIHYDPLNVR